jgi:glycosyltransferase involved in cell wall biosynthesis
MRTVALVTHRFPPHLGGVEVHVAELARRLGAHGWRPEVLTEGTTNGRDITGDGVVVRRFRRPLDRSPYATAPALWRYLRLHGRDYDLVHAHNFHAFPALAAASFATGPLVFTPHYHGLGTSRLGRLLHHPYRPVGRRLVGRADAIVCVSRAESARFAGDFPGAGGRLRIVPNGVDVAAVRRAEPYALDHPVILATGRLHAHKRLDRVLAAFARVPAPARLIVLGDGAMCPELRRQAAALGLDGRVAFEGTVPRGELERWLRTAAAYVSLSEQEAFGIGVAEAAAAGAAVVASDIAAHREIAAMAPEAVALVRADAGPATVAEQLERALATPPPACAGASIPSWDDVAAQTAAVYEDAIARRAA